MPSILPLAASLAGLLAVTPGAPYGSNEGILILPGRTDRVVVESDTLPATVASGVLRWSGLDLHQDRTGIVGRCVRLETPLPPGVYDVRAEVMGEGGIALFLADRSMGPPASSDGLRIFSGSMSIEDQPLRLFLKPDVGTRGGFRAIHISSNQGSRPLRFSSFGHGANAPVTLEPRDALRRVCEYLLRNQISTGLYDYESPAWWEAGYAVRALLCGYAIFVDERYLDAAKRTMDAFLAEQDPDGGWCAYFRAQEGRPACDRRNLADLGAITVCLSLISRFVPPAEKMLYLSAHDRYLGGFATAHEGPRGSFRNGLYAGVDGTEPYSVATATQATSSAAFYEATSDSTYLRRAEEAAWFLVLNWESDGRPGFFPHDGPGPVELEAFEVHDIYYLLEGLLWVRRATRDRLLMDAIDATLRNYLLGERGLVSRVESGWLPSSADPATLSKSNAMLGVLVEIRSHIGESSALDLLIREGTKSICASASQEAYRILAEPYRKPNDPAIVATAFAGLSFAQLVAPGIAFRSAEESR